MAWKNAPVLNKLTSSHQGGGKGPQLWGVDFKGTLHTIYQKTPGGEWTDWMGPNWAGAGYPKQVYELAAAQQVDGRAVLFVLDLRRDLWCISQNSPGGDWGGWQGPGWNGAPRGWFKKLAATQQGPRAVGAQFWGLTDEGTIAGCHQTTREGLWFQGWYDWPAHPQNTQFTEITGARQGDGRAALWALDTRLQLWGMGQQSASGETPPGGWGPWTGPNWQNAPRLRNIASCEGKSGAYIWGIGEDEYRIFHNWQLGSGSDKWGGWQIGDWMNGPMSYELTAAGNVDGCAQLWAISLKQVLHSIAETPPNCFWEMTWTPARRPPGNT